MANIEIPLNNKNTLRLTQSDSDKERCGIGLEYHDKNNELMSRTLIDESDIVMLFNYYSYIKDNDIKHDFINPNGFNEESINEKSFEEELQM